MSKFIGRRFTAGTGADGYTDHGLLTGLLDDDHPQYLITSSVRTTSSPTSGLSKTDTSIGDVFTLINAGSGSALFVQQTGDTVSADAAVDIDNSGNAGRGLSVFSSNDNPSLPLVQFTASDISFDEPILSVEHANPCGLALQILGDAYVACQTEIGEGLVIGNRQTNPFELGKAGIYIKNNELFFVNEFGEERTFTVSGVAGASNILAGCNINVDEVQDGYFEVSLDIQSIAGEGLIVVPGEDDECPELQVDLDAYQVGYDDSDNAIVFADNVQDAITEIDGYLQSLGGTGELVHVRKFGSEADNTPFNTVFSLNGNAYPVGKDRLLVFINGVSQFTPQDFVERDTSSIEFVDNIDFDAVVDILILPGSLGGGSGGTTNLQNAYDNSPSGAKNITLDDGQIRFTQTLGTGSALRLRTSSSTNVAPTLDINHEGTAEGVRVKSIDETKPTLLVQKDTGDRSSVLNTAVIERTTSHIIGGLTGIGSGFLTRLENTGGLLFNASRIITGTLDATDSSEDTYLSLELMEDGVFAEKMRITSEGNLGIKTTVPSDFAVQIAGDVGPDADNIYDLGSASKRWKDGYFGPGSLHVGTGRFFVDGTSGDPFFGHKNGEEFGFQRRTFESSSSPTSNHDGYDSANSGANFNEGDFWINNVDGYVFVCTSNVLTNAEWKQLVLAEENDVVEIAGNGAFIPPRITSSQRDSIVPKNGMIIYNVSIDKFQGYENGAWIDFI